jgi:hypothetical protein
MFANSSRAQASAIRFRRCHLASRQNRSAATEPASGHAPSQSIGGQVWSGSGHAAKARLLALDGLFNSRLPIIISPDRRPDPAKGTWEINPAMKRISAPTMIEDGRLSGNESAARWFDETARHQFLRECELEGLITERAAYGPFGHLSSLHAHRTKLADQPRSATAL